MASRSEALGGFERTSFEAHGARRDVWRRGEGPSVVVISELPGITPLLVSFARRVVDAGMSVAMPSLFGDDGREPTTSYLLSSLTRVCVSREFTVLATGRSSPVVEWLRALARAEHERAGGPGVGVVGMCFTGGFALGMMADAPVIAPVLAEPSLPFSIGRRRAADVGCSAAELASVKAKVADGARVMALRFTGDPAVKPARFETLRRELGDGVIAVELDSSEGNPYGHRKGAHSVLTEDLVDREGSPTMDALHQVLDFLAERLEVRTAP
jgi:dienelactone hydrolase